MYHLTDYIWGDDPVNSVIINQNILNPDLAFTHCRVKIWSRFVRYELKYRGHIYTCRYVELTIVWCPQCCFKFKQIISSFELNLCY